MEPRRMPFVTTAFAALLTAAATLAHCGSRSSSTGSTAPSQTPTPAASTGPSTPQCDASLWAHVYDPQRLQIAAPCSTVTGVVTDFHANDDGDVDIRLALDPPYAGLLNNGNITNLDGHLQTEAICQAQIAGTNADATVACGGFTGTVAVPAVGTHVRVTGVYTYDSNHGWMEIHPISVLTTLP